MCMQPETAIKPGAAVWPDRVGVWASALCVVHCLLTPILLSMSAVFMHFLPSEERVHRSLALLIALIGAIALVRGFRTHRRARGIFLLAAGLVFVFFRGFLRYHAPCAPGRRSV